MIFSLSLTPVLRMAYTSGDNDIRVLLENVRSVLNVGGMFRIADAVGVEAVLLVGYTPAPVDRMGRENANFSKTALGAEKSVVWRQFATTQEALSAYPDCVPVVVEQSPNAVPYTAYTPSHNPIYIFGNETDGVQLATLQTVTAHIYLPMRGSKESLNVTTAAAVILYHHLTVQSL